MTELPNERDGEGGVLDRINMNKKLDEGEDFCL
jgi:hypothetical protein